MFDEFGQPAYGYSAPSFDPCPPVERLTRSR